MNSIELNDSPANKYTKCVLVTGPSGFIGQHCMCHLIDKGFEVHALSRSRHETNPDRGGIQWHVADLFVNGAASFSL